MDWMEMLRELDEVAMRVPRPLVFGHDCHRKAMVDVHERLVQFVYCVRTDRGIMDKGARIEAVVRYHPDTINLGHQTLQRRFEYDQAKAVLRLIHKANAEGLVIVGPCEFVGAHLASN